MEQELVKDLYGHGDYDAVEAKQFYRRLMIDRVFHFLSDADIKFLVTYVENDLNMYATAKVLDRRPTNLYPVLEHIQAKIREGLPELVKTFALGKPQKYVHKDKSWSRFLMAVEQVDYREWGSFYFQEDQTYGPIADGLIPGSTPTRQQLYTATYERLEP